MSLGLWRSRLHPSLYRSPYHHHQNSPLQLFHTAQPQEPRFPPPPPMPHQLYPITPQVHPIFYQLHPYFDFTTASLVAIPCICICVWCGNSGAMVAPRTAAGIASSQFPMTDAQSLTPNTQFHLSTASPTSHNSGLASTYPLPKQSRPHPHFWAKIASVDVNPNFGCIPYWVNFLAASTAYSFLIYRVRCGRNISLAFLFKFVAKFKVSNFTLEWSDCF